MGYWVNWFGSQFSIMNIRRVGIIDLQCAVFSREMRNFLLAQLNNLYFKSLIKSHFALRPATAVAYRLFSKNDYETWKK